MFMTYGLCFDNNTQVSLTKLTMRVKLELEPGGDSVIHDICQLSDRTSVCLN